MAAKSLADLFHAQLQDASSAENQLIKALPKMAKAASCSELRSGIEQNGTFPRHGDHQLRIALLQAATI